MKTVIGLCGYSGSGKSTFCKTICQRFDLPVVSTGEFVRREAIKRGYKLTAENIARVSDEIRRETGQQFMKSMEQELREELHRSPVLLLDCLREESDLMSLCQISDRIVRVAITTSEKGRLARFLTRNRFGDPGSREGFLTLTERERSMGVTKLIEGANYTIDNNGDFSQLFERSATVMRDILDSRH